MLSQRFFRASQAIRPTTITRAARRTYAESGFQGSGTGSVRGAEENAFNKERAAVKAHAAESSDLWRKLSIYVVIPAVILSSLNAKNLWDAHWEHWSHMPPLEERPEYPYQNIRSKNYFWGDGDKTLFWNDNVNYHKKD